MSESNRKKIKLLGFEPVQKAIVVSLATLSRSRPIHYNIITDDDIFESDVLLIDVHDQVVIENWQQLKEIVGDLPVIAIGEESVAGATTWVKRSQLATKLLDAMDSVLLPDQEQSAPPQEAKPSSATSAEVASDTTKPANVDGPESQTAPGVLMVTAPAQVQPSGLASVSTPEPRSSEPTTSTLEQAKAPATDLSTAAPAAPSHDDDVDPQNKSKEALDGELRSAIAQIREGSLSGGAGAIVDNQEPELPIAGNTDSTATGPVSFDRQTDAPAPQSLSVDKATTALNAPAVFKPSSDPANAQGTTPGQDGSQWPKSIVSEENSKHKNRFLIVDDSPYVWTQLRICLESYAVDLDFVSAAEDGLEEVRKRDYDLVFMDVMLPKMNGYDACKQIKKNRASKHVPVIMLTGRSAPANKLKGVLSGCNYYLTKPVSEAEVKAVVDRFYTKVMKKSA